MKHIVIIYLIWNLIVMLAYGLDKLKAKRASQRIPESTLLIMALFFGGAGAWVGMYSFRHKTRHKKFVILVPLCLALNLLIIGWGLLYINGFI